MTELDIKKWVQQASGLIFHGEVVTGNLYASTLVQKGQIWNETYEIDVSQVDFEDNTHKCLKWATIVTKIVNYLLEKKVNYPGISDTIVNLTYVVTMGELYVKYFNFVSIYF